jgi:hypothetical protein
VFTTFAILFTVLGIIMVPHGGNRHTTISKIGCVFIIIAFILWIAILIALIVKGLAFTWANAI